MSEDISPSSVLMIRPSRFGLNTETADDNIFQANSTSIPEKLNEKALHEFEELERKLNLAGINTIVFDQSDHCSSPDAIFPNNWISFHNGQVVIYPMFSEVRRTERRMDVIQLIEKKLNYSVDQILDWSHYEENGLFLEGTGSLVIDRENKHVYSGISERSRIELISLWAKKMNYSYTSFHTELEGIPIYHTNVMMASGPDAIVVCTEVIRNKSERLQLERQLAASGKRIISISANQVKEFAGNIIFLRGLRGRGFWVMSDRARDAFDDAQIRELEKSGQLLSTSIPTIEKYGGGSARCMLCEL
jgi:hypothetical protein